MPSINRKRIVKNTGFLYFRMLLTMMVSLYTSRVVLKVLGVEDFGIYGIVCGVSTLFVFLNSAMSGSTSRFFTVELGRDNRERLQKTFSTALTLHLLIALIVLVLGETIGLWLLENKLNIPADRMYAARWVYHLSLFFTIANIIRVPYNAVIIAHEKMSFYAYTEILYVLMKLGIVYILLVVNMDKLILYASLMFVVTFILLGVYMWYCLWKFSECRYKWGWDKGILYPMLKFSIWDTYGSLGGMARTQGVDILLNIFFGPIFNAASSLAMQVQGTVMAFGTNVLTAVRPQIIKTYAAGEFENTRYLVFNASKFTYLLMLALSLPLVLEMDYVLTLWLGIVPDYGALFCRLMLVFNLFYVMMIPLSGAIHATGRIKWMNLVNGTIYMLVIPITWVAFHYGAPPERPYVINIIAIIITLFTSMLILKKNMPVFQLKIFVFKVLCLCLLITVIASALSVFVQYFFTQGFIRLLIVTLTSTLAIGLCTWTMAVNKSMKIVLINRGLDYVKEMGRKLKRHPNESKKS
ncbi:polysaccharide biosynthesis protein [Bacteroidales bacterium OttesenSCG-928-B11]|nr:polysaccharide biosynthesis protein [Bacteroidales bacterium OttesenSCG-928-C03]MDL2311323.1 polysaccharide biosynthesis protein [Bacteroidales bacterium OttesenSCG-928-B11]MDL2326049.1 polysaccharide biosynthesis protein [Bacteroidales bacterium OttesenSCG-928-A14]